VVGRREGFRRNLRQKKEALQWKVPPAGQMPLNRTHLLSPASISKSSFQNGGAVGWVVCAVTDITGDTVRIAVLAAFALRSIL
jgi:hypothetical protein